MNNDPASPVCYAAGADAEYMGYAGRDELVGALAELLEAERAGARVAQQSRKMTADPDIAGLLEAVHGDEARWCAMLSRQLKRLDALPWPRVGAFYGKAMAIADIAERLAFVNRGQIWVIRKLAALLPRVRDDMLHADLTAMLSSHESNVGMTDALLGRHAVR